MQNPYSRCVFELPGCFLHLLNPCVCPVCLVLTANRPEQRWGRDSMLGMPSMTSTVSRYFWLSFPPTNAKLHNPTTALNNVQFPLSRVQDERTVVCLWFPPWCQMPIESFIWIQGAFDTAPVPHLRNFLSTHLHLFHNMKTFRPPSLSRDRALDRGGRVPSNGRCCSRS